MSSTNSVHVLLIVACILFCVRVSRAVGVYREEGPSSCRLEDQLRTVNETLTAKRDSKDYSLKFDVVQGATYSAIFEQFILKNRLFKGKFDTTSFRPVADLVEVLRTSERVCEEFCSPAEAQLGKVGDKLMVPRIAANNYLRRVTAGHDPDGMRRSPYFKEWPAVRHVQAERPSRAMQCPANMHMVVWHYAAPGTSMTVRAFPLASSAAFFKSRLFHQEQNVTNNSFPFTGHFTAFQRTGFPDNVDVGAADVEAEALPQYAETDLTSHQNADSPGEYAFIPNTHVASFKCATGSCPVVAVCFVDASNLNQFRDSLFFSGSVGASEGELYSVLMQPTFDAELPKNPQDVSFETYMGVPVANDAPAPGSAAGGADAGPPSVASSNRRDRRKKQIAGGGGADFKDWQELTRWRMLVTSLTIQKPAAPGIVTVGRQHAMLTWKSPFVPAPSDKTAFGFKVVFCLVAQAHLEEEIFLPIDFGSADHLQAGCKSQSFYRGADGGGGLQEAVDEAHLRRTGDTALLFRAEVTGLQPDSQYQLRLGVLYDQRQSPLSSYTPPIRTATVSAPTPPLGLPGPLPSTDLKLAFYTGTKAYKTGNRLSGELQFVWPEDDGGLPILGFHVYKRAVTPAADPWEVADQPWHWVGAFPARRDDRQLTTTIELLNLQPSGNIQFSIAAYNSFGSSVKSVPSDATVVALLAGQQHVVHGWGHEHYLGELSHEYLIQHAHVHRGRESATPHGAAAQAMVDHGLTAHCESELVFVDGDRQQLRSSSNHCFHAGVQDNVEAPTVDLWRAHWSPSQISIWAKPAVATPTLSAVLCGGTLVGKIVFVLRGEIPFAEKAVSAQRAGASALVVIDDGKCTKYDQQCLPGASKYLQEGFGAHDIKAHWQRVHIPVFFLLKSEAEKFSNYLPLSDLLFASAEKTGEL